MIWELITLFFFLIILTNCFLFCLKIKEESKRGDVAKSIQCYMIEKEKSEEEAKVHIKSLISNAWKELNKESMKSSISNSVIKLSLNMARTAQFIFQHGDGIGTSKKVTRDRLISLIVQPVR